MQKFIPFLLTVLSIFSTTHNYAQTYLVTDFGAKGDGVTFNTKAIQSAIDRCAATGGKVVIPSGTFLTGTLRLKSKVNLVLLKDALLKGSPSFMDYPDNTIKYVNAFTHDANGKSRKNKALIFAEGVEDISLTGEGTIDGSGDSKEFQLGNDDTPASRLRPCMLLIVDCKRVLVEGLSMKNSAYWLQNYLGCEYVTLRKLNIFAQSNYNQDGIDMDASHVLIEDCKIDVDDDGICFKSHDGNRSVKDIVVRRCSIASNCNAIKFGTMSIGDFKNIRISDIKIQSSSEDHIRQWQKNLKYIGKPITVISGIALESVDGAAIENIKIWNVDMQDVQTPIFIVLGNRGRRSAGGKGFYDTINGEVIADVGSIKNVEIKNIRASSYSKMSSSITAFPGYYVENIRLSNIILNNMGTGTVEDSQVILPEVSKSYPENRMYGLVYPASGLYVRHVKNVILERFIFNLQNPDKRPSVVLDDVIGAKFKSVKFPTGEVGEPIRKIKSTDIK